MSTYGKRCVDLRVALYTRVSTEEQTTENQVLILERIAREREWDYELIEETMTTRKTRPQKSDLLKRLRLREFDAVCVLKLDRWARSTTELLREIEELYHLGVKFISIRDPVDLSSPTGKLQFQIIAAFAEFERNMISQRTKDGLARKRATCQTCGHHRNSHLRDGCVERACKCEKFDGWKHNRGKDKKPRRKSGYYARYAHKHKDTLKRKKYGQYPVKRDQTRGG